MNQVVVNSSSGRERLTISTHKESGCAQGCEWFLDFRRNFEYDITTQRAVHFSHFDLRNTCDIEDLYRLNALIESLVTSKGVFNRTTGVNDFTLKMEIVEESDSKILSIGKSLFRFSCIGRYQQFQTDWIVDQTCFQYISEGQ